MTMKKELTYNKGKWTGKITFNKNGIQTIVQLGKSKDKNVIEKRLNTYKNQ